MRRIRKWRSEVLGSRITGSIGQRWHHTTNVRSRRGVTQHCTHHNYNHDKFNIKYVINVQQYFNLVVNINDGTSQFIIGSARCCVNAEVHSAETQPLRHCSRFSQTCCTHHPKDIARQYALHHCARVEVLHLCWNQGKRHTKGHLFSAGHVDSQTR